ncbi:unnamed protein product [Rotaria socialis]|nr:unnamed protein product [Rotaria socialis]
MKHDGSQVKMRDLRLGDLLLTAYAIENNRIRFQQSPLLGLDIYQKYKNDSPVRYLEIHTNSSSATSPLHITSTNSLLVTKKGESKSRYIFAQEVNIEDYLHSITDDYEFSISSQVTHIKPVVLFDAYAPLTLEGNFIVNNFVVSCYGTFSHSTGHLVKMPRRWLLYYLYFKL